MPPIPDANETRTSKSSQPRSNDIAEKNEIRELTDQFYVTLEAYFSKVKATGESKCKPAYERVGELLAIQPRTWSNAYEIEQMLIHLFDEATMAAELEVRLLEAQGTLRKELADRYREASKQGGTAEARRALLSRVVNDLQWRYTMDEVKRRYTKEITVKTGRLFIAALVAFGTAVLLTLQRTDLLSVNLLLVPAALSGCWGASFSMLSSLKRRLDVSKLDDLKLMRGIGALGSRLLIGAGAASILYFFFVSGLVKGAAFPDFADAATPDAPTFALLVVWCFLAGFSEQLIPGLLAKTEKGLEASPEPEPERPRPPSPATEVATVKQG